MANIPSLPFNGTQLHTALVELNNDAAQVASVAWTDITGKPATFTPSAHTHAWVDITGKPTTFAPDAHTHAIADVTGLQTALDGKQPTTTFKTVNGQTITGTGNIITAETFETNAEAEAYSTANPGAAAFSTEVV